MLELLNVACGQTILRDYAGCHPCGSSSAISHSSLRRQPSQHILEIGIRIVPIIMGRLNQTVATAAARWSMRTRAEHLRRQQDERWLDSRGFLGKQANPFVDEVIA